MFWKYVIEGGVVAAVLIAYFVWARPYLRTLPRFQEVYLEEESFWSAVRTWLDGRRVILIGVWGEIAIWLPDILQSLQLSDMATVFGWDDTKKALANMVLTILMIIFRTKSASSP